MRTYNREGEVPYHAIRKLKRESDRAGLRVVVGRSRRGPLLGARSCFPFFAARASAPCGVTRSASPSLRQRAFRFVELLIWPNTMKGSGVGILAMARLPPLGLVPSHKSW